MHLNNTFEVEPGNGHLRDSFLKDRSIETFLIVAPSDKKSSLSVDKVSIHFSNILPLAFLLHSYEVVLFQLWKLFLPLI